MKGFWKEVVGEQLGAAHITALSETQINIRSLQLTAASHQNKELRCAQIRKAIFRAAGENCKCVKSRLKWPGWRDKISKGCLGHVAVVHGWHGGAGPSRYVP